MSSVRTARVIVDELIRLGVREVVLAPGSRNAPLSYALYDAEQAGLLRLHVRIDERTGAFLALGMAKASGLPVPVVCTSGTAVANLHPAVLEASHSGIPLIALTADRPSDLFGSGANQTTDQARLFGGAVRWASTIAGSSREPAVRSAVDRAIGWALGAGSADPGPVHLNIALAEPLVPAPADEGWRTDLPEFDGPWTELAALRSAGDSGVDLAVLLTDRTVLIAGDAPAALGEAAASFAAAYGIPVLSEPSSGAWGHAVAASPLLVSAPWLEQHRPDQAIVVGHPTLSRAVRQLLSDPRVRTIAVADTPRWVDASMRVRAVLPASALVTEPNVVSTSGDWLSTWQHAGTIADTAIDTLLSESEQWPTSLAAARDIAAALPGGTLLFVGSSSAVRDLEIAATPREDLHVMANRGLAGIDGTLSTAMGAALASGRPTCLLVGDLTFLHDANALIGSPGEPRPDLTIVVVNDDGGGIFSLLEQGDQPDLAAFERIFGTPHGVDLSALCAATGTAYELVATRDELCRAAAAPPSGIRVVELRTDRRAARDLHARAAAAVSAALA